jgi:hypothetical protein
MSDEFGEKKFFKEQETDHGAMKETGAVWRVPPGKSSVPAWGLSPQELDMVQNEQAFDALIAAELDGTIEYVNAVNTKIETYLKL